LLKAKNGTVKNPTKHVRCFQVDEFNFVQADGISFATKNRRKINEIETVTETEIETFSAPQMLNPNPPRKPFQCINYTSPN